MASPNPYTPLGEDEILDPRAEAAEAAPPPDNPNSRVPTHGWDSFINSLSENAQRELGVIDEILISYANFAGEAFNTFDVDSAHVMTRIIALEQSMGSDRDEIAQTNEALSELDKTVTATTNELSDIKKMMIENATMMRENISTVAALREIVDDNASQVKTLAAALGEVMETANNAFRLVSGVETNIIGYNVKLDALVDDVLKMSSEIDGLRATDTTTKLTLLEGTVSQMGSEFVELRKIIEAQSGSNATGDSPTMPPTDTSASWDAVGRDTTQRTSSQGLDDVHPLFPDADPAYRTPRETQVPARPHATRLQEDFARSQENNGDSVGGSTPPRPATQGS
jgi:hypothetical protein